MIRVDNQPTTKLQKDNRPGRTWHTAGELGGARACGYVVDAESAYRFIPLNEADLWTNCYSWWDEDGRVLKQH